MRATIRIDDEPRGESSRSFQAVAAVLEDAVRRHSTRLSRRPPAVSKSAARAASGPVINAEAMNDGVSVDAVRWH